MLHISAQDLADAELVGRAGVRAAIEGESEKMISLRSLGADSAPGYDLVPLSEAAGGEKRVPQEWLDNSPTTVGKLFVDYVRPIIGDLIDYPIPLKDQ